MPRRIVTNSFISGEISPELYGRNDLKAYFNGAAKIENFLVRRTGGIRKRAGTEILWSLDTSEETVENRVRIFPYYFDTSVFGLLVFRINSLTTNLQAKLLAVESGEEVEEGEWVDTQIQTGIRQPSELDNLRYKQIGDTIFFTHMGKQTFLCQITMEQRTLTFKRMENDIVVPVPGAITGTAAGGATVSGQQNLDRHYALYGVTNGIFSKPSTVTVKSKTPWLIGHTVTIEGTLNFSVHDYYVLAKKTGMNYGKLSEIYPVATDLNVKATLVTPNGTDYDPRPASGGMFNPDPNKLFSGNPNLVSTDKSPLSIMRACTIMYPDKTTTPGWNRFVTPHFEHITASTSPPRLSFNAQAVRCSDLSVRDVRALNTFTPRVKMRREYFEAGDDPAVDTPISEETGWLATHWINDNREIRITSWPAGWNPPKPYQTHCFIIEDDSAFTDDSLFIGPIGFNTVVAEPYSLSLQELPIPAEYEPTPTGRFGIFAGAAGTLVEKCFTNLWQEPDLEGGSNKLDSARARTKTNMLLNPAYYFHANAGWLSTVDFTLPTSDALLSSISVYQGGSVLDAQGEKVALQTGHAIAVLSNVDGGSVVEMGRDSFVANETGIFKIDVPLDVSPTTETYRLEFFDETGTPLEVCIRGFTFQHISKTLSFVDDNILPGAVTGQQSVLDVGDGNMDCAIFDVYEQRAVFASSQSLPFTFWMSMAGDLYAFYATRPQADDDAFSATIPAKKASRILHMAAGQKLYLFTEDGVYTVDASSETGLSYRTARIKKISNTTSSPQIEPLHLDEKIIFVGEDNRTVYEMKYDLMNDSVIPHDRSVLATHMTEDDRIIKMAYQRHPDSVLWFLLKSGKLLAMTYMPEHEVWAWSQHTIQPGQENQKIVDIFESGSIIGGNGAETTSDIILVLETIDDEGERGSTVWIERMRPNIAADTLPTDDAKCIDHAPAPDIPRKRPFKVGKKNNNGTPPPVTGPQPKDVAATLKTLMPETQEVSTQGIPKNVVDVCLRIRRTGQLAISPADSTLPYMKGDAPKVDEDDDTVTLLSKDIKIMPRGYINPNGQMEIKSNDQFPAEILSLVFTLGIPE